MKLNAVKIMKSHHDSEDMHWGNQIFRRDTTHSTHGRKRTKKWLKNKWKKELKRQFEEELYERTNSSTRKHDMGDVS